MKVYIRSRHKDVFFKASVTRDLCEFIKKAKIPHDVVVDGPADLGDDDERAYLRRTKRARQTEEDDADFRPAPAHRAAGRRVIRAREGA